MKGNQMLPRLAAATTKKKGKKSKNEGLKVVYISSPMKVKTSATRFRALVQELTGKNSDISRYMDDSGNCDVYREIDCDNIIDGQSSAKEYQQTYDSSMSTPATSSDDSFPDNVFTSQFAGFFHEMSNSFYDPNSQLDVLGSFDDLL